MLFKTLHSEEAVKILAPKFRCVVAHAVHQLTCPIRIKRSALPANVYRASNAALGQSEMDAWRKKGGVLLNFRWYVPSADATVYCECPFAIQYWPEVTVITQPPTWDPHRIELNRMHPSGETCRRLMHAIQTSSIRPEYDFLAGFIGIQDDDLCDRAGIAPRELPTVRRRVCSGHYRKALMITPRVEPEDLSLLAMYRGILTLPVISGERIAFDSALHPFAEKWKRQVKALVKCGSVSMRPKLGFYAPQLFVPRFDITQRLHEVAIARLEEIITLVDGLPLLTEDVIELVARTAST